MKTVREMEQTEMFYNIKFSFSKYKIHIKDPGNHFPQEQID